MDRPQRLVFGSNAEGYDVSRPSYPPALFDDLAGMVGRDTHVLDVGCGTGKATVRLAEAGFTGVGLEPDPDMAAIGRRHLRAHPGWRVEPGEFESFSTGERFGLMTCAQAWHWLDPDVRLQRAADVLAPGGVLALFWNRPAPSDEPVRSAIDAVYADLANDHVPPSIGGRRGTPVDDDLDAMGFADEQTRTYEWSRVYSADEWVALSATQSDHMMLEPAVRDAVLSRVASAIDDHGGEYEHRYSTLLWTARRSS